MQSPEYKIKKKSLNDYSKEQSRMFIFSRPCFLDGVSYSSGDKVINESIISKIMESNILSKKGQIYFI